MKILQQIELGFWHYYIPFIRKSSAVRSIFPKMYPLISNTIFLQFVFPAAICALGGLSLGIFIGFLIP